jgi:hypothetical protein
VFVEGVVGAGYSGHHGTGANRVCMVLNPVIGTDPPVGDGTGTGSIYGAQYWIQGHQTTDVVCVVCYTDFATTFMVPGTNV